MMDLAKKIYNDSEEIDRAWNELIESIKPLNVTRFRSSNILPANTKIADTGKKKPMHHPALITQGDLNNWEFLG